MSYQLPVFSILLLCSTVLVLISAYISWQHRDVAGSVIFTVFMLLVAFWAGSYGIQLIFRSLAAQLFWDNVQYPAGLLTPVSFLVFVLYYTGNTDWLTRRRLVAMCLLPLVASIVVWIPQLRWLIRQDATLVAIGSSVVADVTHGPLFDIAVAYSYLAVVCGLGLLVFTTLRSRKLYQKQTALVTLAAVVPITGSVITYVLGETVIDYTPIGLSVFGVAFTVALTRYRLLDVYPVPRSEILTHIDTGIVATDTNDRIIDINPAAEDILGVADVVGMSIRDIDSPLVSEIVSMDPGMTIDITQSEQQYFRCEKSAIHGAGGQKKTTLYLFTDITARRQRQQELEAQNERLNSFAEVLTHDIRNPLSVASGSAELAQAETTAASDHFEKLHTAHDRIGEIIDDMLALARSGQSVAGTEAVELETVADDAWSVVATETSTLTVESSQSLTADRQRLQQLFENLFRNAVEHGGDEVSVRVGTTESGFFVADDGSGIPPEKRETVFNSGISEIEDGTGVGLAVVKSVVDGHDWSISVSKSTDGGARFDIETYTRRQKP